MVARTDFSKYPLGCAILENLVPLPQGGAMRRPGTKHIAATSDGANTRAYLIPFSFSTIQNYMIEQGESYFRFYKDQGRITVADTTAVITNGLFPDNINDWDDRSGGSGGIAHDATNDRLSLDPGGTASSDIAYAEQDITTGSTGTEHVVRFRVLGSPGNRVRCRVGTAASGAQTLADVICEVGWHTVAFTPSASPFYLGFRVIGSDKVLNGTHNKVVQLDDISIIDNAPVEITTPYSDDDEFRAIKFAQSQDTLYLCHPSHPVYRLGRESHTTWHLTEVLFDDGPYLDLNLTATTLLPSAATGNGINLTLSAITGVNDDTGWQSTDIGRPVRYSKDQTAWGFAIIVSITSTTGAVADVLRDLAGTPTAQTSWKLGQWSSAAGYPGAVAFFEQRLNFAGSTNFPQTFWLSQSGDFHNMTPDNRDGSNDGTVEDDDAFSYTISADQVNVIRWLSPGKQLTIGTIGGEWVAKPDGPVLTPTDIDVKRQTTFGSANIAPVIMRGRLLFVQRAGRKVLEFVFSFDVDNYRGFDLSLLADHIGKGGLLEIAYQQELDSTLWAVRNDGQLVSLTYQPDQEVVGWARHIIGGSFAAGDAVVESVAVIAGSASDEVWVVVKRDINSVVTRHVEVFTEPHEAGDAKEDAFYVDGGISLDSPITISGATAADPVVVTATSHGLSDGDEVRIRKVKGMTELNDGSFLVADKTASTFALTANGNASQITGATAADPVVITAAAHGFADGDIIGTFDVLGMTELNGNTYKVAGKTDDTFQLNDAADATINGTGFTTYTSGGNIYHATDGSGFTAYDSAGEVRLKVLSVSGAGHLEGRTVTIMADGAVHPSKVVASGVVTLDYKAAIVHLGEPYTHTYESLKWEAGSRTGTAQGQTKRIHGVTLMLLESEIANIGPDTDSLTEVPFRDVTDAVDAAVPLFTGEKYHPFDGPFETDTRVVIQSAAPVPFMLLAVAPDIKTNTR